MAAAAAIIPAIIGAAGSIVGGIAANNQAQYQAEVAKMNEQIAKDNAKRAIERGAIEAEANDRQTAALLGEQEAAQSASGLTLTGESAMLTRKSARMLGRLDTLNVIQASNIEAYNYQTQAVNFNTQAEAAKMSGQASLIGAFFDAAGTLGSAYAKMPTSLIGGSTSTAFKPVPKPVGLVY